MIPNDKDCFADVINVIDPQKGTLGEDAECAEDGGVEVREESRSRQYLIA